MIIRTKQFRRILAALVLLVVGSNARTEAAPILFTDRDAFNRVVGASTLITFDEPEACSINPQNLTCTVTYDDLVTFVFDAVGGVGVRPDHITMGRSGLAATGRVLQPVTAFGFDVISVGQGLVPFGGQWFQLNGPQFLGIVSDTPFMAQIGYTGLGFTAPYSIDNMAIRTVPEPTTVLLTALGCLAAGLHRKRRRG